MKSGQPTLFLPVVLTILFGIANPVQAASTPILDESSSLYFNVLDDGTASITYGTENHASPVGIPNYTVFDGKKVVIPGTVSDGEKSYTVSEIGYQAFGYSKITGVEFPASVKTISGLAFSNTSELTGILMIPATVETMQRYSIRNSGPSTFIWEPSKEGTELPDQFFWKLPNLETIVLGANVTKLNQGFLGEDTSTVKDIVFKAANAPEIPVKANGESSTMPPGGLFWANTKPVDITLHVVPGTIDQYTQGNWSAYNFKAIVEDADTYNYNSEPTPDPLLTIQDSYYGIIKLPCSKTEPMVMWLERASENKELYRLDLDGNSILDQLGEDGKLDLGVLDKDHKLLVGWDTISLEPITTTRHFGIDCPGNGRVNLSGIAAGTYVELHDVNGMVTDRGYAGVDGTLTLSGAPSTIAVVVVENTGACKVKI